jgi:hypothetical protein
VLGVDEGYKWRMRRLACCSMPTPNATAGSDSKLQMMYKAKSSKGGNEGVLLRE